MARAQQSRSRSAAERAKQLPWPAIAGSMMAVARRWLALSEKERKHLLALVRESGVRPDRLSAKQRKELRKLIARLDLGGMGAEVNRLVRDARRRRRWRTS